MTKSAYAHDAEIVARKARALAIACPFCAATVGQPCRARESGREKDWPHSRRIDLTVPVNERYQPTKVEAMCCVCGNLRTVNSDYHRHNDPNYARSDEGKRRGWRSTQTLKCLECAQLHPPRDSRQSRRVGLLRREMAAVRAWRGMGRQVSPRQGPATRGVSAAVPSQPQASPPLLGERG
jgi:hypothetical protein